LTREYILIWNKIATLHILVENQNKLRCSRNATKFCRSSLCILYI